MKPKKGNRAVRPRPSTHPRAFFAAPFLVAILGLLTLGFATSDASAVPGTSSPPPATDFDVFWSNFRSAVRANDVAAISRLTEFPFIVRWGNEGPDDYKVTYDKKGFDKKIVERLLALSPGGASTMRDEVLEAERPPQHENDWALCEKFEFRKTRGRWRWTAAFTADDPVLLRMNATSANPISSIKLRSRVVEFVKAKAAVKTGLETRVLNRFEEYFYFEGNEAGRAGPPIRALLKTDGVDERGGMTWQVEALSTKPPAGGDEIDAARKTLLKNGAPFDLFSGKVGKP